MKKIISWVLLLAMALSLFAGCTNEPEATPTTVPTEAVVAEDTNLANAIAYLKAIYKNEGGLTPADFQRLSVVRVADAAYEVVYTVDCDESAAKIVVGDGMVTIDVNEESEVEVPYVLTATITGTDGKTASLTWDHIVPVSMAGRYDEVVDAAYALEDGEALSYEATLKGVITNIDTPYSDQYKNITVTIQVAGREDKPIMCYRLKGDGAADLAVGDTITVKGTLKNYKGTIEFDAGCELQEVISGGGSSKAPEDVDELLDAAFALEPGQSLPYNATLTGVIIDVPNGYSEKYGNVTVIIRVNNKAITCFRMKGEDEGIKTLHLNDTVTVTGVITNYKGTIEFDAGCHMDELVRGEMPVGPKDQLKHIDAAYKLPAGYALGYTTLLTGKITKVNTAYSDKYENITVTIEVPGREDKPIQCFRMVGDDVDKIGKGDTITVRGWLMKYKDTVEFAQSCRLVSWVNYVSPSESLKDPGTMAGRLEQANTLENGEYLPYSFEVQGPVTKINSAYSSQYKNISFTITVDGEQVYCYRVKGDGMDTLAVGDTVKVSGKMTAYNGKAQFDSTAKVTVVSKAPAGGEDTKPPVIPATFAEQMADAVANGTNSYASTFTGTVSNLKQEADYNGMHSFTFNLSDGTDTVYCYKINVAADKVIANGDTVTLTAKLTSYNKKAQFAYTPDSITIVPGSGTTEPETPEIPATLAGQIAAAEKLANGEVLPYTSTITGTITSDPKASTKNEGQYNFYVSDGTNSVQCYYVVCNGFVPAKGDTVTVTGALSAYNGKAQFTSSATATLVKAAEKEEEKEETVPTTLAGQIAAAEKLANGEVLPYTSTITGTITSDPKTSSYNANQFNFYVSDGTNSVQCYWVVCSGFVPAKGDTVTVTGALSAYNGKAQFTSSATATLVKAAEKEEEKEETVPTTLAGQIAAAEKLANGEVLPYTSTITGTITSEPKASSYNEGQYNFYVSDGTNSVQCYYVVCNGFVPAEGDIVTVTGALSAYNGKAQFTSSATAVKG